MTCRELIKFLSDYWSGELSEAEKIRFDEHLAVCPSCVAYLSQYDQTVALARAAYTDPDSPPPDVPFELIQAIQDARRLRG